MPESGNPAKEQQTLDDERVSLSKEAKDKYKAYVILHKYVVSEREALKRIAAKAAHHNGHVILHWSNTSPHQTVAHCANCNMTISVNALPEKGELDVQGAAISNECPIAFIYLAPFTMRIIN